MSRVAPIDVSIYERVKYLEWEAEMMRKDFQAQGDVMRWVGEMAKADERGILDTTIVRHLLTAYAEHEALTRKE